MKEEEPPEIKNPQKIEENINNTNDNFDSLKEKVPKEVFAKYTELINNVDVLISTIKEKLVIKEKITIEDEKLVKENFLIRAKKLLEKYINNSNKNSDNTIEELEKIQSQDIFLLSIFQSLREIKGLKFENFPDFSFSNEYHTPEFISWEEADEMEDIIKKNYKDAPIDVRNTVIASFENTIESGYSYVDIPTLKYKDKVVAFTRLEYNKDGKKVYFGSFNVDPDFANGEIGQAMLERTIDRVAKTHIIEADCNTESNIGAKYIEYGFIATEYYDFYGWPSFKIIRDDKIKNQILGKNISNQEILDNLTSGFIEKGGQKIEIYTSKNQKEFGEIFNSLNNKEKILTRYFKEGENWIIVLEKNLIIKEVEDIEENNNIKYYKGTGGEMTNEEREEFLRNSNYSYKLKKISRDQMFDLALNNTNPNIIIKVGTREEIDSLVRGKDYPEDFNLIRKSFDTKRNLWIKGYEKPINVKQE